MIFNSENLLTGIDIIDEQHQALFKLINNLDKFKESNDSFHQALLELQNYVSNHFKSEEEYMRYMFYPEYPHHKACHDNFVKEYKSLLIKLSQANEPVELGGEFIQFIEVWIKEHYANEDVKMAEYIKANSK